MKVSKPLYSRFDRRPAWPDAVQIIARRKLLARNYVCLVGELRSHRRAAAVYNSSPTELALEAVSSRRRRLDAMVGRYLRTLAELRSAVEVVFPAGRPGLARRRPFARPRP